MSPYVKATLGGFAVMSLIAIALQSPTVWFFAVLLAGAAVVMWLANV